MIKNPYGSEKLLVDMVGASVQKIQMSYDYLRFTTDKGVFQFSVSADCCSSSYFYDFYGVKNLLDNGVITDVNVVANSEYKNNEGDVVVTYGYQFTTVSKEFGEVTSVFSFRNESNGYYGGSLKADKSEVEIPEITDDVIEIKTP